MIIVGERNTDGVALCSSQMDGCHWMARFGQISWFLKVEEIGRTVAADLLEVSAFLSLLVVSSCEG